MLVLTLFRDTRSEFRMVTGLIMLQSHRGNTRNSFLFHMIESALIIPILLVQDSS